MADALRLVIGSDDAGHRYEEVLETDLSGDPLVASLVDVGVEADGHPPYPAVAVEAAQRVAGR